jgi:hypothetical protein
VELLAVGLSLLLTLLAVIIGMAKVQHLPASLEVRDRSGIPPVLWTLWGWVELVAAGFLVVGIFAAHEAAVIAAAVLGLSFLLLAVTQLMKRQPVAAALPALVLFALAAGTAAAIVAAD